MWMPTSQQEYYESRPHRQLLSLGTTQCNHPNPPQTLASQKPQRRGPRRRPTSSPRHQRQGNCHRLASIAEWRQRSRSSASRRTHTTARPVTTYFVTTLIVKRHGK